MIRARLTWMVLGMGVTTVTRWKTERSIAAATERIEARLPVPVARAANALPGDVLRVGGAAVVAGNAAVTAGKVAKGAAGATGTTVRAGRRVVDVSSVARQALRAGRSEVGATVDEIVDRWRAETGSERRRLRSDLLRTTRGEAAALEAALDVRVSPVESLPDAPSPVPPGRRRPTPTLADAVERVQRTYRPPVKPWDRPSQQPGRPGEPGQRRVRSG